MKLHGIVALVLIAVFGSATMAQERTTEVRDSRVRCGLVNLDASGMDAAEAVKVCNDLAGVINDLGFYAVFSQNQMETTLAKYHQKFPRACLDPRCVLALGRDLGYDRMIAGSIDKFNSVYGVRLMLIDVASKHTIQTTSVQGQTGVSAHDVLKVAVIRLHGQSPDSSAAATSDYFGPQVHNEKAWIYSTAACMTAGLFWGLGNRTLSGVRSTVDFGDEQLSGISARGDIIPIFGRPAALGNAYVAASDDAYGVLYNPAGMSWIKQREVAAGYQNRFAGINTIAASYVQKATREIGFGQAILYSGDSLSNEVYFATAASYKFNQLPSFLRPFSLGASLKFLHINTPEQAPNGEQVSSSSEKTWGLALDLGLMWELADHIRYGLLLRNVPGVEHVYNPTQGYSYYEPRATTLSMGGTYQVGYSTMLIAEGAIPIFDDQPWKMSGAIEQTFFRFFKARLGTQKELSFDAPWHITGGFGIEIPMEEGGRKYFILDYAYEYNTLDVFSAPQNFSFRMGF